jgi:hypothetical protein
MFGDIQGFKAPKKKHYRHIGRGGITVGGIPYWELWNGISFPNGSGNSEQSENHSGEETNEPGESGTGSNTVGSTGTPDGGTSPGTV